MRKKTKIRTFEVFKNLGDFKPTSTALLQGSQSAVSLYTRCRVSLATYVGDQKQSHQSLRDYVTFKTYVFIVQIATIELKLSSKSESGRQYPDRGNELFTFAL